MFFNGTTSLVSLGRDWLYLGVLTFQLVHKLAVALIAANTMTNSQSLSFYHCFYALVQVLVWNS